MPHDSFVFRRSCKLHGRRSRSGLPLASCLAENPRTLTALRSHGWPAAKSSRSSSPSLLPPTSPSGLSTFPTRPSAWNICPSLTVGTPPPCPLPDETSANSSSHDAFRAVQYTSEEEVRDYLRWRQVDSPSPSPRVPPRRCVLTERGPAPSAHINNLYNTTFWALVSQGGRSPTAAEQELKVRFPPPSAVHPTRPTHSARTPSGHRLESETGTLVLPFRDQLQRRRPHVQEGEYHPLAGATAIAAAGGRAKRGRGSGPVRRVRDRRCAGEQSGQAIARRSFP